MLEARVIVDDQSGLTGIAFPCLCASKRLIIIAGSSGPDVDETRNYDWRETGQKVDFSFDMIRRYDELGRKRIELLDLERSLAEDIARIIQKE